MQSTVSNHNNAAHPIPNSIRYKQYKEIIIYNQLSYIPGKYMQKIVLNMTVICSIVSYKPINQNLGGYWEDTFCNSYLVETTTRYCVLNIAHSHEHIFL